MRADAVRSPPRPQRTFTLILLVLGKGESRSAATLPRHGKATSSPSSAPHPLPTLPAQVAFRATTRHAGLRKPHSKHVPQAVPDDDAAGRGCRVP